MFHTRVFFFVQENYAGRRDLNPGHTRPVCERRYLIVHAIVPKEGIVIDRRWEHVAFTV